MSKPIKSIMLSVESAQEILNYLATKPYQEVVTVIGLIQSAEQLYEDEDTLIEPKTK